ncbi:MAG: hypothetical protein OXE57_15060 [Alphaproteobacteria bacterium]|nr:hypothetical protein [Alphaproteobacteria bacterium]
MENPALITAWATVAIALVTGLGAAATCFLIWRGLLEMRRSSKERAKDRREAREADLRRHEEAMTALKESMDQGLRRHDETMTALHALIARSAPPGSLGQAD